MKRVISVTLALLLIALTAIPAFTDADVRKVLSDNGKTEYRIVISAKARAAECRFAMQSPILR